MSDDDDRKIINISEARSLMEEQPYTASVMKETEDLLHTEGLVELIEAAAGYALKNGRAFLIAIKGPDRVQDHGGKGGAVRQLGYMAHMEVTLHERFEE